MIKGIGVDLPFSLNLAPRALFKFKNDLGIILSNIINAPS